MKRNKSAEAMLRWLRAEESSPRTGTRVLAWMGYVVFGLFSLFFVGMIVMTTVALLTPDMVDGPDRWLAALYLVVAASGAAYTISRWRGLVRRHWPKRHAGGKDGASAPNLTHLNRDGPASPDGDNAPSSGS